MDHGAGNQLDGQREENSEDDATADTMASTSSDSDSSSDGDYLPEAIPEASMTPQDAKPPSREKRKIMRARRPRTIATQSPNSQQSVTDSRPASPSPLKTRGQRSEQDDPG